MRNKIVNGLTGLLLPFAAYSATPATYGNYQQRKGGQDVSHLSSKATKEVDSRLEDVSQIRDEDQLTLQPGTVTRELIIVDSAVKDKQLILEQAGPGVAIVEITAGDGGVDGLLRALEGFENLSAVHIVAHGESGALFLGGHRVDQQALIDNISAFATINHAIREGGDLMLYGCDLAQGEAGDDFLSILQNNTHVDVAASDDRTGNEVYGGNWDLEIQKGTIETAVLADTLALKDFSGVLFNGTIDFSQTKDAGAYCGAASDNAEVWTSAVQEYYLIVDGANHGTDLYTGTSSIGQAAYTCLNESSVTLRFNGAAPFSPQSLRVANIHSNAHTLTFTSSKGSFNLAFDGVGGPNNVKTVDLTPLGANITGITISSDRVYANFEDFSVADVGVSANSAPTDISLDSTTINANVTGAGAVIGNLGTTDADGGDTHTYSLVSNGASGSGSCSASGDDDNASFQVDNANDDLEASGSLSPGAYNVCIQTSDGTDTFQKSFSISVPVDSDGGLTAAAGVTEPVGLSTTAGSSAAAVDVFDFTLTDGGTSDGLPLEVSEIRVNVSGTSTDTERSQITWRLNGPDAANVTGTYNPTTDAIIFSSLSFSVANGGNETYTINAYYNDKSGLTEDHTIVLSVDGDTDLTVGGSGTQMDTTSAVTNGVGTTIDVMASQLAFTTQPAGSVSGSALSTQPVVIARDAFGNTDVDFTETVTLTEASAGTLSSTTQSAVNGVATFSGLTYTATADQESFTLTANDQDGVGSNLPTVDANAVTSDVVATKLIFDTQPAPTTVSNGVATSFTTVPVVRAVDGNDITDTGYSTGIALAEVNGAGSATLTGTGDIDGSGATVTLTPSSGAATFSGLQATYTVSGSSNETFNLQASSGGLSTADSTQLTASVTPTVSSVSVPANATYVAGQNLDFTVNAGQNITVNTGGGTPRIALDIGGSTVYADYLSGSGTSALTFRYTLQSGDLDADGIGVGALETNGGTLRDGSGNDLDTTLNSVGNTTAILVDAVDPTVSSVAVPAADQYVAGENLDFTLNASENININTSGGTPRIPLTVGSTTRYANYVSGSGTSSIVFRYTVQSGGEDTDGIAVAASVDANGGTLKDAAGNDLNTTLNSVGDTSGVLVDAIAPAGHSVSFDDSTLNSSEVASASFTFLAAEVGTDYNYTISSSGGGTPVAGTGTVSSAGEQISGLDLSGLSDGTVTLSVTLTDSAGNSATAVTDEATLDATIPPVNLSSPAASVINGPFDVTVAFGEPVNDFVGGDITVSNATLGELSGSGASYSVTVTPTDDGSVTVDVPAGVAQDAAGNDNNAATQLTRTFDGTTPAPVVSSDVAAGVTNAPIELTVDFGEAVTGFVAGGLLVTNGSVTGFTDTGNGLYELTVEATGDGDVTLEVPAGVAEDEAGNASEASNTVTVAFDDSNPELLSSEPSAGASAVSYQSDLTLTFDEPVFAVTGDLVLQDATEGVEHTRLDIADSSVVITGTQVAVSLDGPLVPNHDYYVTVAAGSLEDEAGNLWSGILNDTTLSFTVGNEAPQANNDTAEVRQDQSVAIDLLANDTDLEGDLSPASVRVTGEPLHGRVSINPGTGVATYTPAPGFSGSDSFAYRVEDQFRGESNVATVSVDVATEVQPPVAGADVASGAPGDTVVLDLLANDSPGAGGSSLDNLTLTLVNRPLNGSAEVIGGELTYTPEEGFTGVEQLRYTLTDPDGRVSNVADVWINLSESNEPPVTVDDTAVTGAGTAVTLDILANDSDPDGSLDPASVRLTSLAAHGSVSLDETTGELTYTPDEGFRGEDRITYVVGDDAGAVSGVAEVTLSVGLNEAPVARNDQVRLVGDDVQALSVLGNDGNGMAPLVPASLQVVDAPAQGAVSVDTITGQLLYTPDDGFTGTDELTYTVEDDQGRVSAPATVVIGTGVVNNPPLANPDRFVIEEDSSLGLDLLGNDQDLEGSLDPVSITLVSEPQSGQVSVEGDGSVIYTPDQNFFGDDRMTYRVSDASGAESRLVRVDLRVTPVADVPLISGTPTRTVPAEEAYRFTPVARDIDGNPLQFSIANKPAWASFDAATGRLSGTPEAGQAGLTEGIVISVSNGDESASLPAFDLQVVDNSGGEQDAGDEPVNPTGPGEEEESPLFRVDPDNPQLAIPDNGWPALSDGSAATPAYRIGFIDQNGRARSVSVTQGEGVSPPVSSGPDSEGRLGLEFSQTDGSRQQVSIAPDGETEVVVYDQAGDPQPASRLTSRASELESDVASNGNVTSRSVIERSSGGEARVLITQTSNDGVTVSVTTVSDEGEASEATQFQFDLVPASIDLAADGVVNLEGQAVNSASETVRVRVRLDTRGGMTAVSTVDDGTTTQVSGIVTEVPGGAGDLDAAASLMVTPALEAPLTEAVTVDSLGVLSYEDDGTMVTEPGGGSVVLGLDGITRISLNADPDGNGLRRAAEVSQSGPGVQPLSRLEVTDVEGGNSDVFVEQADDGDGFQVRRNLSDGALQSRVRLDGSAEHRLSRNGQPDNEVTSSLPDTLSIFFEDRAVTVADQGDSTFYVEALTNGQVRHEVVRGGNSTRASSRLPGTRTRMEPVEGGAQVVTEADREGRQIRVTARSDGSAQHRLSNRAGKTTEAEIRVPGTSTSISGEGDLTSRVRLGDSDVCAWVATFSNGESSTGFGRYDQTLASCVGIASPTNLDSAFESGNSVSVEEVDGSYSITIEADLTRPIRF